jgi:tetratricopeptide (TPR) repeat protein
METGSTSVRLQMWMASARLIQAHPLTGVGAGAWEVQIPLYQSKTAELETDYYAHNETLQLLAEYGLVGWLFLLALGAYLMYSAWLTWRGRDESAHLEAPWRAVALASVLALLIVSNAGFPWRMASTGALLALCLAILAASDERLGLRTGVGVRSWDWRPRLAHGLFAGLLGCTVLAIYVTHQALACESRLVRAVKMALTINASADSHDPKWNDKKAQVLQLAREGIAINPHYRKITSMVADEVARWGDWKNATWIWESILRSRPYVVAMLTNVVRGHLMAGDLKSAQAYLTRAKAIQPDSPAISSLEVILLIRTGQDGQASKLIRANFLLGHFDYDMINSAYRLAFRTHDWALAIEALQLRNRNWPTMAVDGWLKIGQIYESELNDESQALQAYRSALEAAPSVYRENVRQNIPQPYRAKL